MPDQYDRVLLQAQLDPNLSSSQKKAIIDEINTRRASDLVQSGQLSFEDALNPSAVSLASRVVQSGGKIPTASNEISADEQKKQRVKSDAQRVIDQLERQYYGKEGGLDDLGKGRLLGVIPWLLEKVGLSPRARTYKTTLQSVRPQLARAAGEVGALTEAEQEAAISQLPGFFSTGEEAKQGFEAIKERLNLNNNQDQVISTALEQTQQQTPQVPINDPRVQEALKQGYTIDEIQQFLQGR